VSPIGSMPGQEPGNKGQKYPAEILTADEVAAVIAGCSATAPTGIRNRALLMLLYRSGLRVGETLAVRAADVNLAAHSIRLLDTKSGEPQTRGFHPTATDTLARWMDTRKARGIRGPLFCTLKGRPLHDQYVRLMLHRLAASACLEKRVHPHTLRHTFAWEMEQAGVPVSVISDLLGHSGIAVTARYLKHLTNHQAITVLEQVTLPSVDITPRARRAGE
jgi:site-specific recombinase XerD